MSAKARALWLFVALAAVAAGIARAADEAEGVPVDFSRYRPPEQGEPYVSGVAVRKDGPRLRLTWPASPRQAVKLVIDLRPGEPLFQAIGVVDGRPTNPTDVILGETDPVTFVTVGSRENPPGRPPGMSVFNVFFDSPGRRPHQTYAAKLDLKSVRVEGGPDRVTVVIGRLTAGPFEGELHVSAYSWTNLIQVEAVMATREANRAYVYDAGLVARSPHWRRFGWRDVEGVLKHEDAREGLPNRAVAVRSRAVAVETPRGSVAAFPPPHRYYYPRDLTDNQRTAWFGAGHLGLEPHTGFGVRQTVSGGGAFVPWFNAPPGSAQRMGVFYAVSHGPDGEGIAEALRFTHGDRFPDLAGHVRMTSHWHMAVAVAAMREAAAGKGRTVPDFVRMFRDLNVDLVHLAEFHGDGHPDDPGPLRLPELKAMFDECRRLSALGPTLYLPGEEANAHLGVSRPGQHPGHWLYLFPRPVYWTMKRAQGQPFREDVPGYGPVYHAGDRADVVRLLKAERGLAWTAHPRIKASNFAPDAYRDADYFRDPLWLGAAWKAMPADLASPRLGERVLDLLDDMANWGARKYVLGEVDVFKLDHTHELYGHMNVNYLRLDRVPKYDEDWSPVLDALRNGRFFVTTGELLLTDFTVGGRPSGGSLTLPADGRPKLTLGLKGTFPLAFAEVVSGDGRKVYRERIDLSDNLAFHPVTRDLTPDLSGRTWVRVEAWDVAANGVFSQPVWLEPSGGPATGR